MLSLLLLVYTVSVMGIPVYMHYCGGTLEKVDFVTKGTSCCGGDEMEDESDSCCKDEQILIKNSQDALVKQHQRLIKLNTETAYFYSSAPVFNSHPLGLSNASGFSIRTKPPADQSIQVISTVILRI